MSREERVQRAAELLRSQTGSTTHPRSRYTKAASAVLAVSDVILTGRTAVERVAHVLAYQRCKLMNPKADCPVMGFHAFSPEQREFLRDQQMGNARAVINALLGDRP